MCVKRAYVRFKLYDCERLYIFIIILFLLSLYINKKT